MRLRVMLRGRDLLSSGLVRNALGLYVVQLGAWLLPVATIYFLARRLGPQYWGSLAFMQAFASYVIYLVDYGFNYSATRDAARNRHDPDRLAELLAGVMGAKVALAILSLMIVVPITAFVPPVHRYHSLLWPAMLWALSWGLSPKWYYQGLERMGIVARLDTAARVVSFAAIVLLVWSPADTWKVLAIQGGLLFAAVFIEYGIAYREVGFRLPTARLVWETLRLGWSMFLLCGALSFYTIGNGFILGLFGSPAVVGYYVGAERISKAFGNLLNPLTQAVYPRTSHLALTGRREAAKLARMSLLLMGAAGCLYGAMVFVMAPFLVRMVLGPGFESAVPVLRILALLPPLVAFSNVLGVQWMLALGLDRLVNMVIFSASFLNVTLAFILVPRYLQVGMATALVAAEALVTVGLYAVLRVKHLDPLSIARIRAPEVPASMPA